MQKRSGAGFSPGFLCAPWGREQQPIVLLDCFIPSQGLQKLWIGDLEESEDLGARLEEVLLAGTPAGVQGGSGGAVGRRRSQRPTVTPGALLIRKALSGFNALLLVVLRVLTLFKRACAFILP